MTVERRATVSTPGGWSLNLTRWQGWVALITKLIALLLIGYAFMTFLAQKNFNERIESAITPPHGRVFIAIDHSIRDHEMRVEKRLDDITIQQNENTVLLKEIRDKLKDGGS